MWHIYQPVMLRVLLDRNGEATLEQIAQALFGYDVPQIEYYVLLAKVIEGMVARLVRNQSLVIQIPSCTVKV